MKAIVTPDQPITLKWMCKDWSLHRTIAIYFLAASSLGELLLPFLTSDNSIFNSIPFTLITICTLILLLFNFKHYLPAHNEPNGPHYWDKTIQYPRSYGSSLLATRKWQKKLAKAVKNKKGEERRLGFKITWQIRFALNKERKREQQEKQDTYDNQDTKRNSWLHEILTSDTQNVF